MGHPRPKRSKQWMLSVVAVFPLKVFVPKRIRKLAHRAVPSLPDVAIASLSALRISGLMVYFFMPALVRLAGAWLERWGKAAHALRIIDQEINFPFAERPQISPGASAFSLKERFSR